MICRLSKRSTPQHSRTKTCCRFCASCCTASAMFSPSSPERTRVCLGMRSSRDARQRTGAPPWRCWARLPSHPRGRDRGSAARSSARVWEYSTLRGPRGPWFSATRPSMAAWVSCRMRASRPLPLARRMARRLAVRRPSRRGADARMETVGAARVAPGQALGHLNVL